MQSVWICTSNPTASYLSIAICVDLNIKPHCFLPVHCNLCGSAHQTPLLLTCPSQSVWICTSNPTASYLSIAICVDLNIKPHCFLPVHRNLCGSAHQTPLLLTCPLQSVWICTLNPTASYLSIAICVDLHIKPHCFLPVHCNLCGSEHQTPSLLTCPLQSVWICTSNPTASYLSIAICVDLHIEPHCFLPVHCNLCGSECQTPLLLTCPLQSVWICTSNPTASYLSIAICVDLHIKPHCFLPVHCNLCGSAHQTPMLHTQLSAQ